MLVSGYDDNNECIEKIGRYIKKLKPSKSYLLVPTRPPAESVVKRPATQDLKVAFETIQKIAKVDVECITGDEGESFFFTDDIINDLLSILSVHPVKEDVIDKQLEERDLSWDVVNNLIQQGLIERYIYENKKFYKKKLG